MIAAIYIIVITYIIVWWLISLSKRSDRHDTIDMEKYILWKIKDIDDKIEELQKEKEQLRKIIRQ